MKKMAAFITIVLLCNIAGPTYAQVQVRVHAGLPVYCPPPPARVVVVRPRPLIAPVVMVRPVPPAYVVVRPRPRRVIVY